MLNVNLQHYTGKEVKKNHEYEALFRKFIDNRCSPAEVERVLDSLKSSESAKTIYILIAQELQQAALSNERIDSRISEEMRRKILAQVRENPIPAFVTSVNPHPAVLRSGKRSYWGMAAAITGILLLAAASGYRLFIYKPFIKYATSYGEIATIFLPDSSKVTLNGNSEIRYAPGLGMQDQREVWIEGEAFFSVKHTVDNREFIVHPSDDLDVVVLGTEFNVYDRADATRVVLNSGKVKLNIRRNKRTDQVDMMPGELVELHDNSKYEKREVDPELFSSWISGKVVLDNTSFREIAVLLEETYGLSVSVPDTSLYRERFSGTVPSENVEALLKALALSFNLRIKAEGNKVIFNAK